MTTNWPADKVERRKVKALLPYARNARTHSDGQVAQIARSVEEFGWTVPVLVDEEGTIIAGHGRVLAAKKLGLAEVPVMVARGWTEAQRRAYVLADNQLALNAGWDDGLLREELRALGEAGFDLSLTGFDDLKLASFIAGIAPGAEPDDAPAGEPQAVSIYGDVWVLDGHRVRCGDATNAEDVRSLMGGDLAHMVFTDPPYGVNIKGAKSASGKQMRIAGDLTQTAIPFSFDLAVAAATRDGARFYFCGGEGNISLYAKLFDRHLGQMPRHLIWVKNGFTMKPNGYHNQYEIIFHGYKSGGGSLSNWYGARTEDAASDVWQISRDAPSTYEHPTQKPVALSLRAITNSAPEGGIVYEPFLGSGSTLIACETSGRVCRAIEIDPAYVDVAVRRWQAFTGRSAVLDGTTSTFDEIAAQRAASEAA